MLVGELEDAWQFIPELPLADMAGEVCFVACASENNAARIFLDWMKAIVGTENCATFDCVGLKFDDLLLYTELLASRGLRASVVLILNADLYFKKGFTPRGRVLLESLVKAARAQRRVVFIEYVHDVKAPLLIEDMQRSRVFLTGAPAHIYVTGEFEETDEGREMRVVASMYRALSARQVETLRISVPAR